MMSVYKQMLPELGGYLTRGAQVDLPRVEAFIQRIGSYEDAIFQKRMRLLKRCAVRKGRVCTVRLSCVLRAADARCCAVSVPG
jgi:5'-3' exoribonuclease 2